MPKPKMTSLSSGPILASDLPAEMDLPSGKEDNLYYLESERSGDGERRQWIERDFRGWYSIAEVEMILADMKKVAAFFSIS
jgi:hypothetical protein